MKKIAFFLITIFILIFVFVFVKNRSDNKRKGTYQYLRRATILLDQDNFSEAKKQLDLALKNSPYSENIQKEVIYGYILYARNLMEQEKFNEGIDLLKLALGIRGNNAMIMQHLAIAYVDKAVYLANNSDIDASNQVLAKVFKISSRSKFLARDISNYMLGKAIEQTNKDNDIVGLFLLKSSFFIWERSQTAEFIGNINYASGDTVEALIYWEKAFELSHNENEKERIKTYIEKGEIELGVRTEMKKIASKKFLISFYSGYDLDIYKVSDMLEEIYIDVGESLDAYPHQGVTIIFYQQDDFKKIFKQSDNVKGFYDGSIRIPIDNFQDLDLFKAVLAHEYTHALVSMITENNAPVWLNEGLAEYQRNRYLPVDLSSVREYIGKGNKLTIAQIEQWFSQWLNTPSVAALTYSAAFSVIEFIVSRWGIDGLKSFLEKIKNKRHYINAIDETFFLSLEDFEKMFNDSLNTNMMLEKT